MTFAAEEAETPATFWDIHRGHIFLLAAWVLVVGVVLVHSKWRARATGERATTLPHTRWLWATAGASVVAAGLHLSVIDEHFHEAVLYGTFFLVLTIAQLGWAAWLVRRPTLPLLFAGAAASSLVVVLWLATRTIGIPIGPEAGEKETYGFRDVACSAAEVLLVVFALLAVRAVRSVVAVRRRPALAV
jgi:hypothetical protein